MSELTGAKAPVPYNEDLGAYSGQEKYVRLIKEMYIDVKPRVRSCVGTTEGFEVKVGLHQGSALSPFMFKIVFDVLTRGVRQRWAMEHNVCRRCGSVWRDEWGGWTITGGVEGSAGERRYEDKPGKDGVQEMYTPLPG